MSDSPEFTLTEYQLTISAAKVIGRGNYECDADIHRLTFVGATIARELTMRDTSGEPLCFPMHAGNGEVKPPAPGEDRLLPKLHRTPLHPSVNNVIGDYMVMTGRDVNYALSAMIYLAGHTAVLTKLEPDRKGQKKHVPYLWVSEILDPSAPIDQLATAVLRS